MFNMYVLRNTSMCFYKVHETKCATHHARATEDIGVFIQRKRAVK